MTEFTLPAAESTAFARALGQRHQLAAGAFGALLFTWVEQSDAAFGLKDVASGRYLHANEKLGLLWGVEVAALIGKTDTELLGSNTAAPLRSADAVASAQLLPHQSEHHLQQGPLRRDFQVLRLALPSAEPSVPARLACLWVDITEQRQREAQLAQALVQLEQQQVYAETLRREQQEGTRRDDATGLYHAAHFEDQLRREVDLSSREHREFALVAIQLDPLPGAAPTPQARLRVLEALGRLLRSNTRAMDASSRIDEEHFAILLSGVGLATAHSRMEGLRRQCATQLVVLNGQSLGFSISMGVASFPHTAHTQEELVSAADAALAQAQRRGGNQVALASIRFEAQDGAGGESP